MCPAGGRSGGLTARRPAALGCSEAGGRRGMDNATRTGRRSVLLGAAAFAMPRRPSRAQDQPGGGRLVRVVVPSAPGAFDIYARIMAPRLSELLGAPMVIDNRPGANGNIGMAEVQRATPDGLTVLFAAIGSLSINVSVYRGMPLDPIEDLLPVALPVTPPMLWVAGAEGPLRSLPDVVAAARAAPGRGPGPSGRGCRASSNGSCGGRCEAPRVTGMVVAAESFRHRRARAGRRARARPSGGEG